MSFYEDNLFDITVECRNCHDMYDCQIKLNSEREIALINELLANLFTRCHNCGADAKNILMTVSNETFTAEEIKLIRENKNKKI